MRGFVKMSAIAINVVLLPPKNVMSLAIRINKKRVKDLNKENKKIILNTHDCLPHISLAMGCIRLKNVPKVIDILKDIAKDVTKLKLEIKQIKIWRIPNGKNGYGFMIQDNKKLQKLHETIMERLLPYLNYSIKLNMLYQKPSPEKITLHWIKKYLKISSFKNFSPHITIGIGSNNRLENHNIKSSLKLPIKFNATKIALCHLGNYCTCRKVLKIVKICKNI